MNKIINASLFLLFILSLSSCSQEYISPKDKAFNEIIQIRDINKSMVLEFWNVDEINSLHIGSGVELVAINNSKNKIIFPADFGISILFFDRSTNKWIDIPNTMNYYPTGKRLLFPKTEDTEGFLGIGVFPEIIINSEPIELRIVVSGDTKNWIPFFNKQVGAYIDLTLQP